MPQRSTHLGSVVERLIGGFLRRTPVTFSRLANVALWHFLADLTDDEQIAIMRSYSVMARQTPKAIKSCQEVTS